MLDTGADGSFVYAKLADELHSASHGVVTIKLRTFGAVTAKEIRCIDTENNVNCGSLRKLSWHVYWGQTSKERSILHTKKAYKVEHSRPWSSPSPRSVWSTPLHVAIEARTCTHAIREQGLWRAPHP
ncbi:unnamed protein product [Haemonchus placei]|uniref:Uncharacterized protein n=1 Tax=Haemonchus placei TaxID=6290 RepID=A0A3P7ULQ2_HAEPC|nr:unnamed protein product [Haemonchus placei]